MTTYAEKREHVRVLKDIEKAELAEDGGRKSRYAPTAVLMQRTPANLRRMIRRAQERAAKREMGE